MNEVTNPSAFDVGINDRLPFGQLLMLGLQHVFGMTGMFVFPGLLGRSFNLPAERIAYLYGMSFMVCGLITVLQSVWLLRLPVVQGTYAGNFAALLAVGHMQGGGLGAAYGSFFVASLIWCLLSVPIRRLSFIGLFARFLRAPMHGVQMLSKVAWDDRQFAAAGLAVLVGLGGLFVSPEVLQTMPLAAKLLVQQPVISGGLTLVVLHSLLCRSASAPEAAQA